MLICEKCRTIFFVQKICTKSNHPLVPLETKNGEIHAFATFGDKKYHVCLELTKTMRHLKRQFLSKIFKEEKWMENDYYLGNLYGEDAFEEDKKIEYYCKDNNAHFSLVKKGWLYSLSQYWSFSQEQKLK